MNSRTTNNIGGDGNEKSSVRLHHAPGGTSNFSLGWDPEPPKQVNNSHRYQHNQQSADNPYAKPQQQQQQSYTTKYDSRVDAYGNKQNDNSPSKTSVKVHHAPGGQSSLNLGMDPQPNYGGGGQGGNYGGGQVSYGGGYGNNQGNSYGGNQGGKQGGYGGNQGSYGGGNQGGYGGGNQGSYGGNQGGYGGNQGGYGGNQGSNQGGNQGGGSSIYGGVNDHGKGDSNKTSVKVHAPPGGKSNFTLG